MRADLYTNGDYILHLDSDVLVLRDVTYDDMFHLDKPVLPFRRYRDDSPEGELILSVFPPLHHRWLIKMTKASE